MISLGRDEASTVSKVLEKSGKNGDYESAALLTELRRLLLYFTTS